MGQIIKTLPGNVVALCGTFLAACVIGSLTFLAATGAEADSVIQVINTVLNFVTLGAAGSAVAVGASAAADSRRAAQQTNGALDGRIRAAIDEALTAQRETDIRSGATTYSVVPLEEGRDSNG